MKFLVALLLFLFFNFNFQKCYSRVARTSSNELESTGCYTCKEEGQTCNGDIFGIGDCKDDLICGTDKDDATLQRFVCQKPSLDGCVDSTVCDIGLLCDLGGSYKCEDIRFAGVGEGCSKENDCSSGNKCEGGFCKSNNTECLSYLDCKGSETCDLEGKCIPEVSIGGECTADYQCGRVSFCSKFTNKCTLISSVADGEKCSGDFNCKLFSKCVDGVCSQGQLISSSDDKVSNCSLSTDTSCEIGAYCECSSGLCKKFPNSPSQIYLDKITCMKKNNCQMVENLHSKSSCFTKHCKHVEIEAFKDNICKNTIYEINYQNVEHQITAASAFLHFNAALLSSSLIFAFLLYFKL
ncbi:hypothetical protein DICPUDRAFT_54296 [Dictyostelium purpureum]|uniref:Dickkopf N-terminal cysteine-rich domain-containing protein n=1 Tax=Dictyostelium purpureum TaxID=5786 RepID=F0ZGG3_DICPU|nr:uncharacterized protein DICPUDRAFT_54296 [Dictyostelium purpureum]EGC36937.1 hypothetical protein DICPUDRAFT_54296 [Dictyostelium purpureum]|eukprot:XP_003286505.1 hypothetical protein DICPUDRAFT_54296 [Dictyostelium purpureum]